MNGETSHQQTDSGSGSFYPLAAEKEKAGFQTLIKRFFDYLFPEHLVCHCCNREAVVNDYGICRACEGTLRFPSIQAAIPNIDGITSGLVYDGFAADAIKRFKYEGKLYEKELFVHFMKIPIEWQFDYVIPVPLHPKRIRKRGYNQSEVLAKELCRRYNLSLGNGFLQRTRNTPRQATLDADERKRNLKNAFAASPDCMGKVFLLVDDVRTTGTTLSECASALKKAGAVRVYAITACCASDMG